MSETVTAVPESPPGETDQGEGVRGTMNGKRGRWGRLGAPLLAGALVLGACGTPAGTPAGAGAPAAGAATAAGRTMSDADGVCRTIVPVGFVEQGAEDGYFPALDGSGFAEVDAAMAAPGAPIEEGTWPIRGRFAARLAGYHETTSDGAGDRSRLEFDGAFNGTPGHGATVFRRFGGTICAATLFSTLDRGHWFDATLTLLADRLEAPVIAIRVTATAEVAIAPSPTAGPPPAAPSLDAATARPADGVVVFGGATRETKDIVEVLAPRITFRPGEMVAYAAAGKGWRRAPSVERVLSAVAADGSERAVSKATIALIDPTRDLFSGTIATGGLADGRYRLAFVRDGVVVAAGTFAIEGMPAAGGP